MADFKAKAGAAGIKKETIARLLQEDIDSEDVVALLSEDDIKALSLSTGQTLVMLRWVSSLTKPTTVPTEDDGTLGLADILADDDVSVPGKAYFPCDFMGGPSCTDSDTTVCTQGSSRLVLRGGAKPPKSGTAHPAPVDLGQRPNHEKTHQRGLSFVP